MKSPRSQAVNHHKGTIGTIYGQGPHIGNRNENGRKPANIAVDLKS